MSEHPEDEAVQDLMQRAAAIAVKTMNKQGPSLVGEELVLAIYHELKSSKPVTYPRITKMWVERNDHDDGRGGRNTEIHSRMLEVQLTEHYFKNVRISRDAYELMGGKER